MRRALKRLGKKILGLVELSIGRNELVEAENIGRGRDSF